ncbi:MAG TPA: peptidyl-prolyl cis-trans isomerase [Bacillales bacterium]|nr:peptidyl-prolyl cis-trans isomerase [Bacillales bacterium]
MPDIIVLTGNVNYTLTLDPSSWLFDDRKFELEPYFEEPHDLDNPPRKFNKRDLLLKDYTFAVPFKPFLENAEPKPESAKLIVETQSGETHELSMEQAKKGILAFTKAGKFLKEDGPAHFYLGDGSNRKQPIKEIAKLVVK